ncbi:MAG: SRPBCC family protein [Alphaproteobacteria bacterium]|jgi:uncharacterized protein YndB with AHSA1/START domain|nr:SRPBCC family protein [Alphaproteobacteria bacterium]
MKITYSFELNADINKVFSYFDDADKQKLWLVNVVEMIPHPDKKDEKGEPFTMRMKHGKKIVDYQGYTLAVEKPTFLHVCVGDSKFNMEIKYYLKAVSDSITKIDYECEVSSKSMIFRIIFALMKPFTTKIMKKQFNTLKQLVE